MPQPGGLRAIRVLVSGRVQGVGYRMASYERARRLGVTGWVRNREDGSVEVFAQGDAKQLDAFVLWLREGPAYSRVDGVSIRDAALDPSIDSFYPRQ